MKRPGRRTVFTAAATVVGASLLAIVVAAAIGVVVSLAHLAWLFIYVLAAGASF